MCVCFYMAIYKSLCINKHNLLISIVQQGFANDAVHSVVCICHVNCQAEEDHSSWDGGLYKVRSGLHRSKLRSHHSEEEREPSFTEKSQESSYQDSGELTFSPRRHVWKWARMDTWMLQCWYCTANWYSQAAYLLPISLKKEIVLKLHEYSWVSASHSVLILNICATSVARKQDWAYTHL